MEDILAARLEDMVRAKDVRGGDLGDISGGTYVHPDSVFFRIFCRPL